MLRRGCARTPEELPGLGSEPGGQISQPLEEPSGIQRARYFQYLPDPGHLPPGLGLGHLLRRLANGAVVTEINVKSPHLGLVGTRARSSIALRVSRISSGGPNMAETP